jgi:hypothetical protein
MDSGNKTTLHGKLDAFIRKYYKNQLIKGLIYGTGLVLAFFLLAIIFEYIGQFETTGRTFLFWAFIFTSALVLGKYIVIPLSKLGRMGRIITHEQAAKIVGDHFSDVQDKLLNTLQLNQMSERTKPEQYGLIQASINQRTEALYPVPFTSAIDLTQNKKHIWWLLFPIVVFGMVLFLNSEIITGSTDRLLHYGAHYEQAAPFSFIISNDSLEVVEKEDFTLVVNLEGSYAPEKVFINANGKIRKMERESPVSFRYTFKNVREDIPFYFTAENFNSVQHTLTTIPNPVILNFEAYLDYPSYTKRKDQTIKNTGDLILPEGTRVNWKFKTSNTREVHIEIGDSAHILKETL